MAAREFTVSSRPQDVWGWLVILDFFLAGTGAGLFVISLTLGFPLGMALAIILVLVGGALLLGDLTRPYSAWRVLLRPGSSWISRGTIGIGVFTVLALLHLIYLLSQPAGGLFSNVAWLGVPGWEKAVAVIAGLGAIFIALYPGLLLGSMRAIPLWGNIFSPMLFLFSALIAGLGLAFLLPQNVNSPGVSTILYGYGIGLVLLQSLLLLSLIFTSQAGTIKDSVQRLTRGNLRFQFYAGVFLLGLVAPLVFMVLSLALSSYTVLAVAAGILLLVGQLLLRYSLIRAGLYVSPV